MPIQGDATRWPIPLEPVGRVREVSGQAIATRFVLVPLPFVPVSGVFLPGLPGVPAALPLRRIHVRSVLVAYLRWWSAFVGAWWLAHAVLLERGEAWPGAGLLLLAIAVGAAAQAPGRERLRREILGVAAGVNALPEWLARPAGQRVYAALLADWVMARGAGEASDWRDAIDEGGADVVLLPLLYALAAYAHAIDPASGTAVRRHRAWSAVVERWLPRVAPPR